MSRNERIEAVKALIAKGLSTEQIKKYAEEETDWDVTAGTVDGYVKDAVKLYHNGKAPASLSSQQPPAAPAAPPAAPPAAAAPAPAAENKEAKAQQQKQDKMEKQLGEKNNAQRAAYSESMALIHDNLKALVETIEDEIPKMQPVSNLRRMRFLKAQLVRTLKTTFKDYSDYE